jgi:pimeloyl-ACP methyl ester carboxylesterase
MLEQYFEIETDDNFLIYGVLNSEIKSDRLLIFVHGLTGEKENHLYYNGARFFPALGIDTVRFDLFSNHKRGRSLTHCAISTFADDLTRVIQNFHNDYAEIHIVGHSIGGCAAMNADLSQVTSLVLWDCSLYVQGQDDSHFAYSEYFDCYIAHLKIEYFLSRQLINERRQQNEQVVAKVTRPIKLIFAGNSKVHQSWATALSSITVNHAVTSIEGASHGFNEYGVDKPLFEETLQWVQLEHTV